MNAADSSLATPNDTPQVLLEHHLKLLRLPTFLREYDKVARQCAAESVDYPRYLLRLIHQARFGYPSHSRQLRDA